MVRVVEDAHLIRDYPRFVKGQNQIAPSARLEIFNVYEPQKCFPSAWLNSTVPVVFEFKGMESTDSSYVWKETLYRLFLVQMGGRFSKANLTLSAFVKTLINGDWSARVTRIVNKLLKDKKEWENQKAEAERSRQPHVSQMRALQSSSFLRKLL